MPNLCLDNIRDLFVAWLREAGSKPFLWNSVSRWPEYDLGQVLGQRTILGIGASWDPSDMTCPAQLHLQQYCLDAVDLRVFGKFVVGNEETLVYVKDEAGQR